MKRLRFCQSLTVRLTLLFALVSILILFVLGLAVSYSINLHFIEQDQTDLTHQVIYWQDKAETIQTQQEMLSLFQQMADEVRGKHGAFIAVLAQDGRILFSSARVALPADIMSYVLHQGVSPPFSWVVKGAPVRMVAGKLQAKYKELQGGVVLMGMDISHHELFLRSFKYSMWFSIAIAAVLMGVLGRLSVWGGLKPLRSLVKKASLVTAHNLNERLPVDSLPVELQGLALSLNQMLARLEDSFARLSDFSSDIAHELRTPLCSLKTQIQVTLSHPRAIDEYREVVYSCAEEIERLTRMISDMLFLAKADHDLIIPNQGAVKIEAEVQSLIEYYDVLAQERGITLNCHGAGVVRGEALMLRRALSNLLSNAIKYSDSDSVVQIAIMTIEDSSIVQLIITNSGPTIEAEALVRLFDRFYRVDRSRHVEAGSDSVGLGLAITRSIIRAHSGDVKVSSQNGVIQFIVMLPAFCETTGC